MLLINGRVETLDICNGCSNGNCAGCLLGDAGGAINLNPPKKKTTSTRAAAVQKAIREKVLSRTAGGTYVGNSSLVEFVKDIGSVPGDLIAEFAHYGTTPGIIYEIYSEGKKTKDQITTRMATDPEFKEKVNNVVNKVVTTGSDVLDTITGPIVGTSQMLTWMPYIVIAGIGLLALFAFKNPESVSTPRKVSLY